MRFYFAHRAFSDWLIATLVAVSIFFFSHSERFSNSLPATDDRVYLTTATIAATLLGFSLASASFLVSHTRSESMEFLRSSASFFSQLLSLLRSSLWRFLALCIGSLACFAIQLVDPTAALSLYGFLVVPAALGAVTLIWTVGAVLGLTR